MNSLMPSCLATACAVVLLSPVIITILIPSSCSWRMASGVVSFMGSATPSSPAGLPSTARNMTVLPCCLNASALAAMPEGSIPRVSMRAWLPSATGRPSTLPVTPLPVTDWNEAVPGGLHPPFRCAGHYCRSQGVLAAGFEAGPYERIVLHQTHLRASLRSVWVFPP